MKKFLLFVLLTVHASATTYYFSFTDGDDTRSSAQAQNKATPWKHIRGMTGVTSNAASMTMTAGDSYIFKGGDTWDHTCFPWTLAGSGSAGAGNSYYGVDATWYLGGSWTRPVFDREYTSASTDLLSFGSANYITLDNLEIKRLNTTNNYGVWLVNQSSGGTHSTIQNCYIHDWRTTAGTDDAHGGVGGKSFTPWPTDFVLDNTEVENSANHDNGVCCRMVAVMRNGCKIHDNSSAVLFFLDFNGSYLYSINGAGFDAAYHFNGLYCDPVQMGQTVGYIRNSYLHDVAAGANMAYPNPRGATVYLYNNVIYGTMSSQGAVEIDPYNYGSGTGGTVLAYNNTIYNDSASLQAFIVVSRSPKLLQLDLYNNHVINASALTNASGSNVTTYNNGNNLSQTAATATSQGYVLGNLYQPTLASNGTVDAGISESGTFTTDLLGITRPKGSAWDIGAYEFNNYGPTLSSATMTTATNLATVFTAAVNKGDAAGMKITVAGVDYSGTYANGDTTTTLNWTIPQTIYTGATPLTNTFANSGSGLNAVSDSALVASYGPTTTNNSSGTAIPVPTSPSATKTGQTTVDVAWTKGDSQETFIIYRSLTDSSYVSVGTAAASVQIFHDSGLAAGTKYYYKVAATGQGVTSAQTSSVNATTDPVAAPTFPVLRNPATLPLGL